MIFISTEIITRHLEGQYFPGIHEKPIRVSYRGIAESHKTNKAFYQLVWLYVEGSLICKLDFCQLEDIEKPIEKCNNEPFEK